MGRYVPIRFNDAEAAFLERSFAASEDAGLSTHIKRVYFDALRPNTEAVASLRTELRRMHELLQRMEPGRAGQPDEVLVLTVLCGLYLMVRRSVTESVRAQADQALDAAVIELYLRDG